MPARFVSLDVSQTNTSEHTRRGTNMRQSNTRMRVFLRTLPENMDIFREGNPSSVGLYLDIVPSEKRKILKLEKKVVSMKVCAQVGYQSSLYSNYISDTTKAQTCEVLVCLSKQLCCCG